MAIHRRVLLIAGLAAVAGLGTAAVLAFNPTTTGITWQTALPKPPMLGDAIDLADRAIVQRDQSLVNTPRWTQARSDVSYDMFPVFAPLLEADFTARQHPQTAALLDYARQYLNRASTEAKAIYPRARPFKSMPALRVCQSPAPINSSYPSGHAAWGSLAARILMELYPNHEQQILARGNDYGQSRVICAVHYPSDVAAGRIMAAVVLARLEEDREYQRLLAAAKVAAK